MSLAENKRLLRRAALNKRNEIVSKASSESGDHLAAHIVKLVKTFTKVNTVSGFLSIGNEIETLPSLNALADAGYQTCLPVVLEKECPLGFRAWTDGDPLERGPLKTLHPIPDAPDIIPDILLVPLLAYDRRGYRLGWGGGFYDRTLGAYQTEGRPVIAIGIGYDDQKIDQVPPDAFDMVMDWIVTEKKIIQITKAEF
jgi:5-formyltetrahydrofolate cyclo-ligase